MRCGPAEEFWRAAAADLVTPLLLGGAVGIGVLRGDAAGDAGEFYTPTSPASNDLKTNEQQEVAERAEATRKQLISASSAFFFCATSESD
jgi:hypothetical protein